MPDRFTADAKAPICILLDSSGTGGIERHVTILARGLQDRGLDARIVLLQDHGDTNFVKLLHAEKLAFEQLDGSWRGLRKALENISPMLVHTHGYKAGVMGRVTARLASIPCVSTFHAGERAPFPVSLYQTLDEWTAWLGASVSVSSQISRRLPFGATLIPNFIASPPSPTLSPLPAHVSFVGRLSHEKGPDLFCELARQSSRDIAFHAYGDGPMRTELEARYGDCVRFHGAVSDMQAVWRSTGLLLITSRAEGLPMAALEAFAASIPIACTRVGDLPTLVADQVNGWLFDAADNTGAQQAIDKWRACVAGPHEDLRKAAWTRAQDFSVTKGIESLCHVYAAAMGRPKTTTVQSSIG